LNRVSRLPLGEERHGTPKRCERGERARADLVERIGGLAPAAVEDGIGRLIPRSRAPELADLLSKLLGVTRSRGSEERCWNRCDVWPRLELLEQVARPICLS